jgi:hypothetical protein
MIIKTNNRNNIHTFFIRIICMLTNVHVAIRHFIGLERRHAIEKFLTWASNMRDDSIVFHQHSTRTLWYVSQGIHFNRFSTRERPYAPSRMYNPFVLVHMPLRNLVNRLVNGSCCIQSSVCSRDLFKFKPVINFPIKLHHVCIGYANALHEH